jgi:hypothetical protein
MSTKASLAAAPGHRSPPLGRARRQPTPLAGGTRHPAPDPISPSHGASMFRVPFASAMSDADTAVLARSLELVTHMHPKLHDSPVSPGVVRLDFDSGLFLERGSSEGQWVLVGRTWGHPPPHDVHDWHLRAAAAAHRLDATVNPPGAPRARGARGTAAPPDRPTSKHSAGIARRLPMGPG